jgi:hypothetical protein
MQLIWILKLKQELSELLSFSMGWEKFAYDGTGKFHD